MTKPTDLELATMVEAATRPLPHIIGQLRQTCDLAAQHNWSRVTFAAVIRALCDQLAAPASAMKAIADVAVAAVRAEHPAAADPEAN